MTSLLRRVARKIAEWIPRTPQPHSNTGASGGFQAIPEWERVPGWLRADQLRGWQGPAVVGAQRDRWVEFLGQIQGPEPLGVSHESPSSRGREQTWAHNLVMSYGYVLGRAAQFLEEISILDWGSGIGHYYALTRALWPEIRLRYTAYDFAEFCETGRELLPGVDFVEDPETALAGSYHLVMAGSSLWYSQDWQQCLASLAAASTKYVYVTRMIFVRESPSFVAVQRPWRYGYNTEYQCWVLNRLSFLDAAEACDLCLEREFIFGEAPAIYGAPEHGTFRGFLFRKTRS